MDAVPNEVFGSGAIGRGTPPTEESVIPAAFDVRTWCNCDVVSRAHCGHDIVEFQLATRVAVKPNNERIVVAWFVVLWDEESMREI